MTEPITITTYRQLDALVAEKLMGPSYDGKLPHYSTDWIAADGVACYADLTIWYYLKKGTIWINPPWDGMGNSEKVSFSPDEVGIPFSEDDWATILRRKVKAIEMNTAMCIVALSTRGIEVDLKLESPEDQANWRGMLAGDRTV